MSQSQNAFSSLMNQYGAQAEQEKIAQAKADKRAETFRQARRTATLSILAGAFAAAAYYHNEVTAQVSRGMEKAFFKSPYAQAETGATSKVADIQAHAEKNKQIIESTYK